jgi:TRAP-type mannitol/chloroaromatic compound transport system permease small subunit
VDNLLRALLPVSQGIDTLNRRLGRWIAWLIFAAVVVSTVNALVRKAFDTSSNAWLELQWVLFSAVFLLCSPWTLLSNEHIRIDIVNNQLPKQLRNWIDLIGHAFFLLPLTVIMIWTGIPFFLKSWHVDEQSFSAGGLPQWPTKSLVSIGFALLFLQGISELIKRASVMRGLIPDPYESTRSAIEAEVEHIVEAIEKH